MRVAVKGHRGMERLLVEALVGAGHEVVAPLLPADVALVDADVPWGMWEATCRSHRRVIVYPHGGSLICHGDGQYPVGETTVAQLVCGEGYAQLLSQCGYPKPLFVVGCTHSEVLGWRPPPHRWRVLVAPSVTGGGALTSTLYTVLSELPGEMPARVTVRDRVFDPNPWSAAEEIDAHDVVLTSSYTFLATALARGCPAILWDATDGSNDGHPAQHPDLWRLAGYPIVADGVRDLHDLLSLVALACNEKVIRDWRHEFVGERFDPDAFVKTVEALA